VDKEQANVFSSEDEELLNQSTAPSQDTKPTPRDATET